MGTRTHSQMGDKSLALAHRVDRVLFALTALMLLAGCATGQALGGAGGFPPRTPVKDSPEQPPTCGGEEVREGWPETALEEAKALLAPFLR